LQFEFQINILSTKVDELQLLSGGTIAQ